MKINKLKNIVLFLIATISIISCSNSRKTIAIEEGWDLLGESKVNFIRDRDKIDVLNTNLYTAIRFKVESKDVHISQLEIVYLNGDKLNPVIDDDVVAGQYSRDIELGPEGRAIRSVDFSYRSRGNIFKGRAKVLVFGKRYTQPYRYQQQ